MLGRPICKTNFVLTSCPRVEGEHLDGINEEGKQISVNKVQYYLNILFQSEKVLKENVNTSQLSGLKSNINQAATFQTSRSLNKLKLSRLCCFVVWIYEVYKVVLRDQVVDTFGFRRYNKSKLFSKLYPICISSEAY